mmetsp:Transcript_21895/g.24450  ORF Transcript_21895/g.24450 Transcript_21895/m.24450 type:complete len:91 (-) Transcript_21895:5-277(-)
MQATYDRLSKELIQYLSSSTTTKQVFVAIAGCPGSGKSTTAKQLVALVNSQLPNAAAYFPMDGFHYHKRELAQMDDPELARRKRGALSTC